MSYLSAWISDVIKAMQDRCYVLVQAALATACGPIPSPSKVAQCDDSSRSCAISRVIRKRAL